MGKRNAKQFCCDFNFKYSSESVFLNKKVSQKNGKPHLNQIIYMKIIAYLIIINQSYYRLKIDLKVKLKNKYFLNLV